MKRPAIGHTFRMENRHAQAAAKAKKGRTRAERLEARVTAEQKSLIERAAALQGRSVTDFVLTSVQDAARRAIEEHNQLALSVAYIIPRSGFVGPLYGMELNQRSWHHLDYVDYGDGELSDEDFATRYRERDPAEVVSRDMIERSQQGDKPAGSV